ncbi:PEP-CTERM sorting domain-containing protein [Sphaerotilus sp.]|uniref:PEP-CTERM sorting domain-containing protein n=1 Tax=Sphaerotilus sp. TaxID=2093942 RepID=UPI00286DC934|nr:PEP-CTERM sorting domain-containing protein [Sphaerotilus sp.]
MLKKFVSILALAGLASGQAFAATNLGFESGTTGWTVTNGVLTAVTTNTAPITVFNDYDSNSNTVADDDITTAYNIAAQTGNAFGLLNNNYMGSVTFAFNAGGVPTNANDMLWLRMFSAEYDFQGLTGGINDDFVRVTYTGGVAGTVTDTFYASQGTYVDSGWVGFAIPVGTTNMQIAVVDVNGINAPQVGLDFTAAPVPEPEVNLMMLAGLGVIGGLARRRMKKAA